MNRRSSYRYFDNKRIVIAGGGGFFGSHIKEKLKEYKCEIFVPRTKDGWDFTRLEKCLEYFKKTRPHFVINCAANQGGVGYHVGKQGELFMDNMRMGLFLMEAAQKTNVKKFVNIVAGCSYPGYLEKDVLNENDYWNGELHESIFSYGFPRKASVAYGKALRMQYGFNSIHLILANMYGPGDHFNFAQSKALPALLRKFYEAKKKNEPQVEIWGTGKPVRDWLYVKDAVAGILAAGESYSKVDPLNIASGVGISIKRLAETIRDIVGYRGKIIYNTDKPEGALKKILGIQKMKMELNWFPETTIKKGIRETLEWLKMNYEFAISH